MDQPLKILLIGPLPPPIGGATVLFQQLVQHLSGRPDVELKVVSTTQESRKSAGLRLMTTLRVIAEVCRLAPSCQLISFHASNRGGLLFGPVLYLLSRLYRKPLVVRFFGGAFDLYYQGLGYWRQKLVLATVLQAEVCYFETRKIIERLRASAPQARNVRWFPNHKPGQAVPERSDVETGGPRRFVFISQVKKSKGIWELVAAAQQLPGISVHIYGPLLEGITPEQLKHGNVSYQGVLQPEQVISALAAYDVLVLPTSYEGEGYPGIILEAYAAGIPVISTQWRSIPELVSADSGILIQPGNVQQLVQAMQQLTDPAVYRRLSQGVPRKFQEFRAEVWTDRFVEDCFEVGGLKK